MYLKKLSSNKPMKSMEFSPSSINIILGSKTTNRANKTVNGSGKTLSLKLIDFCLGANITDQLKKLEGWEFSLRFAIDNNEYYVSRSIDKQNFFMLNQEEKVKKEFLSFMYNTNFNVNHDIKSLSFRSLIARFLRIPPFAYNAWQKCKEKEQEDIALLNNSFLLGLDVDLVERKREHKGNMTTLITNKRTLKNDNDLKKILKGTDIGVSITSLKKDIHDLESKIENFNISEGYNELKIETETMKARKNELLNKIAYYQNVISSIDKSLETTIDVTSEQVIQMYQEVQVVFSESLLKSIEDVNNFHVRLLETRKNRLQIDKLDYLARIKKLKYELALIDNKLTQNLDNLRYSGTLSEYESLQNKLNDMRIRLYKMTEYDGVISGIDFKISDRKAEIANGNKEALKYIETISDFRDAISYKFKEYVDFIYEESRESGISITVNDKDNKIQFDIEPEISGDNSEGINHVKLFCMDFLYLSLQKNHTIKFLYHDSTVFNGIDPRQVYRMLKLARRICEAEGLQYIINLNYNTFDDINRFAQAEKLTDDSCDFEDYLAKTIVVKLFDDSPESTLLGFEFN